MNHVHLIHLKRREFALSERELADLLGISEGRMSRLEHHKAVTRLETAFALQVIFDVEPRELFPNIYSQVEDAVMRRAVRLDRMLRELTDPASVKKHRLLAAMVQRTKRAPDL